MPWVIDKKDLTSKPQPLNLISDMKQIISIQTRNGLEYVSSFALSGNSFVWASEADKAEAVVYEPMIAMLVIPVLTALGFEAKTETL